MPAIRPSPANVRSQSFYVACTHARCWHCGLSARLLALAMPRGHETLDPDTECDAWHRASVPAFLFYVEYLPRDVQDCLNRLSPFFRPAYSPATLNSYWANHCEHCGALLDDHELHCEPDSAFMPSSEDAAAQIQLLHMKARFEAAAAGYAYEPEFFRSMRKS